MGVHYDASPHPIRVARQKRGLSIGALAALVDMPLSTLTKIETRRTTRLYVDQLVAIGHQLDVPWWQLADGGNMAAQRKRAAR